MAPDDESGEGLFAGQYYWEVPATMTSCTVAIHLPSEVSAGAGYYGDHFGAVHNVAMQGSVPHSVAFSPVYTPPPTSATGPPAWAPKTTTATAPNHLSATGPKPSHSGGDSSSRLLVALIADVAVSLGALAFVFRRRLVPAVCHLTATPAQKGQPMCERSSPPQAYGARAKAGPQGPGRSEYRLRRDRLDQAGKVTPRYGDRLRHIGVGRAYAGQRVLLLVADMDVRVLSETGELLRHTVIDPAKDYQSCRQ